jgi:hypothetical protein
MSSTNNTISGVDINLNNCRIISDPEGYDINQLLNDKKSENINKGNILVLGDLLDSTFIGEPNDEQLKSKIYNIRNLNLVNTNDNIYVAMGNRDLNKIKCQQLLALNNEIEFLGKSSTKTLMDLVNNLKTICNNDDNPWVVEKLTDNNGFSPFWNNRRDTELWNGNKQIEHTCKARFDIIFGRDGSVGTMSAQNLLKTIPMELKELDFIDKTPEDDETNAACVLAFFKLALMGENEKKKLSDIPFTINDINLIGILRKFYDRTHNFICAYKEFGDDKNKQIALFSHGGITKTFLDTEGFCNFKLLEDGVKAEFNSQTGGYLGTGKKVALETIKTRIDTYNKHYREKISTCLSEKTQEIPQDEISNLLYLLATSAPTKVDKYDAEKLSPIMPGIFNMRDNAILCNDACIYNFFGHKPDGYGPVVDKFELENVQQKISNIDKTKKTYSYNINCDISNTLLGNLGRVNNDTLSTNYSYLSSSIEGNKLVLKNNSSITVNDTVKSQFGIYLTDNNLISDNEYNLLELSNEILSYENEKKWSALGKYKFKNDTSHQLLAIQEGFKMKPVLLNDQGEVQHTTTILLGGKRKTIRQSNRKNKHRNTSKLNKSNLYQHNKYTKRHNKIKNKLKKTRKN